MTDTATVTTLVEDVPTLKSVRASGNWVGSMTTEIGVRDFTFRSDEPEAIGGTNSAPTPMEIVAGAVNGCITVVVETVALELGLTVRSLETTSHAHMDTRGFRGAADVSPHYQDYTLTITVDVNGDDADRAVLVSQSEKRCPAINLIRDAGVPLETQWVFATETEEPPR